MSTRCAGALLVSFLSAVTSAPLSAQDWAFWAYPQRTAAESTRAPLPLYVVVNRLGPDTLLPESELQTRLSTQFQQQGYTISPGSFGPHDPPMDHVRVQIVVFTTGAFWVEARRFCRPAEVGVGHSDGETWRTNHMSNSHYWAATQEQFSQLLEHSLPELRHRAYCPTPPTD
jgi:hypothetical protein